MPKNLSWRRLVQRLRGLGFDGPYSGGRHLFMIKEGLERYFKTFNFRNFTASEYLSKGMG